MGGKKRKTRKFRFFYWNGELHKVLRINRPANLVEAWHFKGRQSVALLYNDFRRNAGQAIRLHQVAKLMRVSPETIKDVLANEEIRPPERSYALDGMFKYSYRWWSEKDVLELHEALLGHHVGRPRKDGKITPNQKLPTAAEIRAYFRNEETLYIQAEDGRMVPVFEAQRW